MASNTSDAPVPAAAGAEAVGRLLDALDGLIGARTMPAIGEALMAVQGATAARDEAGNTIALGRAGERLAAALRQEGARLLAREAGDAERLVVSITASLADDPAWRTYRHFVDVERPQLRQAGIDPALPGDDGRTVAANDSVLAAIGRLQRRHRQWQDEQAAERMVQAAYGFAAIPDE